MTHLIRSHPSVAQGGRELPYLRGAYFFFSLKRRNRVKNILFDYGKGIFNVIRAAFIHLLIKIYFEWVSTPLTNAVLHVTHQKYI